MKEPAVCLASRISSPISVVAAVVVTVAVFPRSRKVMSETPAHFSAQLLLQFGVQSFSCSLCAPENLSLSPSARVTVVAFPPVA